MVTYYTAIKFLHLLTATVTIVLFVLRFYWLQVDNALMSRHWVRIVPHINDTILFVTGIFLIWITHLSPFSSMGSWLTEKLFGVIIYIVLGIIALGRRPRSGKGRWGAFLAALVMLYVIIKLATTKMPLSGIV